MESKEIKKLVMNLKSLVKIKKEEHVPNRTVSEPPELKMTKEEEEAHDTKYSNSLIRFQNALANAQNQAEMYKSWINNQQIVLEKKQIELKTLKITLNEEEKKKSQLQLAIEQLKHQKKMLQLKKKDLNNKEEYKQFENDMIQVNTENRNLNMYLQLSDNSNIKQLEEDINFLKINIEKIRNELNILNNN